MIQLSISDEALEKLLEKFGDDFVDLFSSMSTRVQNTSNKLSATEYDEDSDDYEDEDDEDYDEDDDEGDVEDSDEDDDDDGGILSNVESEGFVNGEYTVLFSHGGCSWKGVVAGNKDVLESFIYRLDFSKTGNREVFLVAKKKWCDRTSIYEEGFAAGGSFNTDLNAIKVWFLDQAKFRLLEGEPVVTNTYFQDMDYTVNFDYFGLSWRGSLVKLSKKKVRVELYLVFNPKHKQQPHVVYKDGALNDTPSLVRSEEIEIDESSPKTLPSFQSYFFSYAKEYAKINSGEVKDLDYFYVGKTSKIDNYDRECREVQISIMKVKCPSDFEIVEVLPNDDIMQIDVRLKFQEVIWKVKFELVHTRGTSHYNVCVQSGKQTSSFEVLERTPFSFHGNSLLYIKLVEACAKIRLLIDKYRDASTPQSLVFFGNPFTKENLPEDFKLPKKKSKTNFYNAQTGQIHLSHKKRDFLIEYNVTGNTFYIYRCEKDDTNVTNIRHGKLTDLLGTQGNIIDRMDATGLKSIAEESFSNIREDCMTKEASSEAK